MSTFWNETCRSPPKIYSSVNNSNAGTSSTFIDFLVAIKAIKLFLILYFQIELYSVSSVWNKEVKQHGKTFMFDGEEDTAWYSDQVSLPFISYLNIFDHNNKEKC